jgi:hypothetical protein
MAALEAYLHALITLCAATVLETSYYVALQSLLNEVGAGLRPRVQAVIHPKDTGAGIPDFGLFDENQPNDQQPAHGVIEAKPGVTQGEPRADVQAIALLTMVGGAPAFTVNAGWGRFGIGSAVMPGRGRAVENDGLIDVYLNESTCWRGLPAEVWAYTLGGYQVLKKWLSYRETAVLGRPLKAEEAREFMHIARRIAALLALSPALDAGYVSLR